MTAEIKTCPDCGKDFPSTSEFFNPEYGAGGHYLSRRCRQCESRRLWRSDRGGIWSSMHAREHVDPYTGRSWGES